MNLRSCQVVALISLVSIYSVPGHPDVTPVPGFPASMNLVSGSGMLFHDLDMDGNDEIIITGNGKVYAYRMDGTPFLKPDGVLLSSAGVVKINAPPAVYDLTGNGSPEIVVSADRLYVADVDGNILLELDIGGRSIAAPVIADIDGDGKPEIIGSGRNMDKPRKNFIYVYATYYDKGDLKADLMPGFPIGDVAGSSPAVADLDPGFPGLELAWGQRDGTVWAVHYDGTFVRGFPLKHGKLAANTSPAIADVNGDGNPEIVIGTSNSTLLVIEADGQLRQGWPQQTGNLAISSPAVADIDGDGKMEIFVGSHEGDFYGFDSNGNHLPGFPKKTNDSIYSSPIIADIDNDNVLEVLVGSKDGMLYAWKTRTGEPADGFPIGFAEPVYSSPIVGTDGNGHTLLGISVSDKLHLYDLGPGTWNPNQQPWPMMKHDPQRTGNLDYRANSQGQDITPPHWVNGVGIQGAFQVEDNTVRIYWNKAVDTESEPVRYNLYVSEVSAGAVLPEKGIANVTAVPSNLASGYDYEFNISPSTTELREYSTYRFEVRAVDSAPIPNETIDTGAFVDVHILDFMTISEINSSLISDPSAIVGKEVVTEMMGLSYNSSLYTEAIDAGKFVYDILTLKSLGDIAAMGLGLGGLDPTAFARSWLKERTTYRLVAGTNPREHLDWYQVVSPVAREVENQIGKGWPVVAKVKVIEKSVYGENPRTLEVISFHHNWSRFAFLPAGFNQSEYQLYSFDHLNNEEVNYNIVGVKGALIGCIEARYSDGSNAILRLHNLRSTDEVSKPVYIKVPASDAKLPNVNSIVGVYGTVGIYQQSHCINTIPERVSLIAGSESSIQGDKHRETIYTGNVISAAESPVDLHIYDSLGNHTGAVYDLQGSAIGVELGIPNSIYLGPDFHPELMIIADPRTGPYRQEVKAIGDGSYSLTTIATDSDDREIYRVQWEDKLIARGEIDAVSIPVTRDESEDIIAQEFLPSDVNSDGSVDILDLIAVASAFGSWQTDENYNPSADVNSDGVIDESDLIIVGRDFGTEAVPSQP